MSTTGEVIKRERERKGWSQRELARRADIDQRQVSRFEKAEAEPSLSDAARLAEQLGVSLTELAGMPYRGLDFSGDWFAGWQTQKDGVERIDVHPVTIRQDGAYLSVKAPIPARSVAEGSYAWEGELRLWDNASLMGWYVATEGAVRSKGTMYFALHPHGQAMVGGWVGLSYAAPVVRGWGAIARTREQVEELMAKLVAAEGDLQTWQMLNL